MKKLKPLVVVLGSIRLIGTKRLKREKMGRRRSRMGQHDALELNAHERLVIAEPEQWRAGRRFIKTAHARLQEFYVRTPIGNIALKSVVPGLRRFREKAMHEAAHGAPGRPGGNRTHRHWQVLVEGPTWADLTDDSLSLLMTLMAEDLPTAFFESEN